MEAHRMFLVCLVLLELQIYHRLQYIYFIIKRITLNLCDQNLMYYLIFLSNCILFISHFFTIFKKLTYSLRIDWAFTANLLVSFIFYKYFYTIAIINWTSIYILLVKLANSVIILLLLTSLNFLLSIFTSVSSNYF